MARLLIVVFALLLTAGTCPAGQPASEKCKLVKQKIRHVQSLMRAGYTRAQGERLEAQLRKLRGERAKLCR